MLTVTTARAELRAALLTADCHAIDRSINSSALEASLAVLRAAFMATAIEAAWCTTAAALTEDTWAGLLLAAAAIA